MDIKTEQRLRKILSLAEKGVGGEKDNAKRLLTKLLKKHDISLSEIMDEATETHWFRYKGEMERNLLNQIIVSAASIDCDRWRSPKRRESLGADVTKHQAIEIELKFCAYKKAWAEEVDDLFQAFIHNTISSLRRLRIPILR
jgi:hypothetical protein